MSRLYRRARLAHWESRIGVEATAEKSIEAEQGLKRFLRDELRVAAFSQTAPVDDDALGPSIANWQAFARRESVTSAEERAWPPLLLEEAQVRARAREAERSILGSTTSIGDIQYAASSDPLAKRRAEACALLTALSEAYAHCGLDTLLRLRNQVARSAGYPDFYAYSTAKNDLMNREQLFEQLGEMLSTNAPTYDSLLKTQARTHGPAGLSPEWLAYNLYGQQSVDINQYFPQERLVDVALQTMLDCGVTFGGANLTLDLFARKGKTPGGYTELVEPRTLGSRADIRVSMSAGGEPSIADQRELLHELGHAAHFANIDGTCVIHYFRLPGTVAESFATTFEQLASTEGWLVRHGRTREGQPLPPSLALEYVAQKRAVHAFHLRNMLAVAYVEDALYRLPDSEMTPANIIGTATQADREVTRLRVPTHPALNVPHLYDTEASACFHTYAVAADFASRLFRAMRLSLPEHHGQGLAELFLDFWRQGSRVSLAQLKSLHQTKLPSTSPSQVDANSARLSARISIANGREVVGIIENEAKLSALCMHVGSALPHQNPA